MAQAVFRRVIMRKILLLITAVMLICSFNNVASALIWTDSVNLGNSQLTGTGSTYWTHHLPSTEFDSSFDIPPDVVNSASLAIVTKRGIGDNDFVFYDVAVDINLGSLGADGNSSYTTVLDLVDKGIFYTGSIWATDDLLNFRLDYDARGNGNSNGYFLTLVSSTFTLDYTKYVDGSDDNNNNNNNNNNNGVPAPVPEPSTMVLLGSGLLGLVYVGRSRRRK
jgi:hypothetical protein